MRVADIEFGQQLQYNAAMEKTIRSEHEGKLIKMIVSNGLLFLDTETQNRVLVQLMLPESALQTVIHDLNYYKDSCLVRIDSVNGLSLLFTIIIFSHSLHFGENAPMKFVINKAIERDMKKFYIQKNAMDFFIEEFLVNDMCFVRGNGGADKVILVGNNFMGVFQKTKQNIMQAIEIQRLHNKHSIEGSITIFRGNISFQDNLNNAQLSDEANQKYTESIKDTHELLKLWKLYNELEVETAKERAEELGSLKYSFTFRKYGEDNRLSQIFYLEEKPTAVFLDADIGYAVASNENFRESDITNSRTVFIGNQALLETTPQGEKFQLTIGLEDENVLIPDEGYLMGSFTGSKIMAERRERALHKILDGKTPLANLKLILQSGASSEIVIKNKTAVTDKLLKKIFGTKNINFTERQREAIDIAINTPDIAIIQGPPGTGKTTVIRAIIDRLNVIYNGNVHILVSSAQHDAVDNAIKNVEYSGLPINRIGGKRTDHSGRTTHSIVKWIDELSQACDNALDHEEDGHERIAIREMLMLSQEINKHKEDKEVVSSKLKELYPLLIKFDVNPNIIERLERLIKKSNNSISGQGVNGIEPANADFVELLEKQRITIGAYIDDGREQLSRLVRWVRTNLDVEIEIPGIWNELRMATEAAEIESCMSAFKESVEELLDKYSNVNAPAEDLFELDVDYILNETKQHFEIKINNNVKTVSDILWDFKDQLENPKKISELITKYTKISAATCQQSVSNSNAITQRKPGMEYDYVIIDESARANPLDLLIPMGLGKKIILVGDHKQLPQLLEDNVVKRLLESKKDPEIRELLNEPLFSRLFNMLEKTKYSSRKRTVMLTDQYRMHPRIAQFVSDYFYDGSLSSGVTAEQRQHNLARYDYHPIAWIDVPKNLGKENSANEKSISRKVEVEKVMHEVQEIIKSNPDYSVGIITFYKKQAFAFQGEIKKLSLQDQSHIEVGTVDSFQGKEFDVVILSTVRSNSYKDKKKSVGFLDYKNRLNVAFSRGKRLMLVVGDAHTVAVNEAGPIIKELYMFYQTCKEEGYYERI